MSSDKLSIALRSRARLFAHVFWGACAQCEHALRIEDLQKYVAIADVVVAVCLMTS